MDDESTYMVSNCWVDTYVISERGWQILHTDPIRSANLIAFDMQCMQKHGCSIVTAATKVHTSDNQDIIVIICDAILNEGGSISLALEFQSHEFGIIIDSMSHQHKHINGTLGMQAIYLPDDNNTIVPMEFRGPLPPTIPPTHHGRTWSCYLSTS